MYFRLPELLARLSVIAKYRLSALLLVGSGEKNVATNDGRRAVPASRNGALPGDVVRRTPISRRILIWVRDTIALRPAPPRPIGRIHRDSVVNLLAESVQGKEYRGGNDDYVKEGRQGFSPGVS